MGSRHTRPLPPLLPRVSTLWLPDGWWGPWSPEETPEPGAWPRPILGSPTLTSAVHIAPARHPALRPRGEGLRRRGQRDWLDVAGDAHGLVQLQQGDVRPVLGCVVVGVGDDPADGEQLVLVIQVLLPQLHPEVRGVADFPGDRDGPLLRAEPPSGRPGAWVEPQRTPPSGPLETHGPTQWAAVSTHWGWIKEPPQRCLQYPWLTRRLTCQGHLLPGASWPPTMPARCRAWPGAGAGSLQPWAPLSPPPAPGLVGVGEGRDPAGPGSGLTRGYGDQAQQEGQRQQREHLQGAGKGLRSGIWGCGVWVSGVQGCGGTGSRVWVWAVGVWGRGVWVWSLGLGSRGVGSVG